MEDMPKPLTVLNPAPSPAACCAPLDSAPLTAREADDLAGLLKALADATRLRIVSMMLANERFEACTCDLADALGLTQPTITHHLRKLATAGLVTAERRQGPWTYYRVATEALAGLAKVISPAVSGS
jgi:ArsR family transcriptional regulator